MRHRLLSGTSLRTLQAGLVWAGVSASSPACALPQGGVVSGGSAQIAASGAVLQVDQSTDRAVIDWKSFDIATGETTRFRQPSAASATLNRIHDQDPSQILGGLSANGTVALVNPNGMVFGQGSRIDVGSLIATTVDIPNERFLSGENLLFGQPGETDAAVVNQGNISVHEGGLAALVGPQVTNTGVIQAKMGRVALGAGQIFTVDLYGDGLISLAASDTLTQVAVNQKGGIRAEGGTVLLTTAEAKRVMNQAVNMDGWVDVSGLTEETGSIVIHAPQGTANVTGKLHADGAAGAGGRLQITGGHVKVGVGAMLTALGTFGGGDIKIGGDYLGGGTTPRAKTTRMETGATIDASANASGQGGRVIVWSDDRTEFGGLIRVKGGALGGNGGFVETSSKEILMAHGLVDASSPHGKGGEWLLDPNNVTINATADANVAGNPNWTTTNDNAVVTVNSIQTALNAGTSVTITTGAAGANTQAGNITVDSPIAKTAGGAASLSLIAHNNIVVNENISSISGALNVTLWSDAVTPDGVGAVTISTAAITTNGGNVVIGGGANPTVNPARASTDDGVTLNDGDISTGAGNISIRGQGDATGANNDGIVVRNGSVLQTTTGNITLIGTGGAGTGNNYGISVIEPGTQITSQDGAIVLTGNGGGNGTAATNRGIGVESTAVIRSTGTDPTTGTITLDGTGGNGTNNNHGVFVTAAGTEVSAVDGDISITGTGGGNGAGTGNDGIRMSTSAAVSSSGDAGISLTGTSGTGTSDDFDSSGGANVIGGAAADGNITLTGDTFDLTAMSVQTTGDITVRPRTANTPIGLAGGAGTLLLSTAELGSFNAGDELIFGRSTGTGLMNISAYATWSTLAGTGVRFVSDTGVVSVNGAQAFGARNLTLETNADPVIGAAVAGTGILTLMPAAAGTTVGFAGGAGTISISAADITAFGATWSDYIFGRSDQTGAVQIGAQAWSVPMTWRSGAGGSIVVTGAQTASAASDTTFTFSGPTTLGADVSTAAATGGTQDITFSDDVALTANAQILAGNGDVLIAGTVDGAFDLTLSAAGTITISDDIGAGTPLDDLTITSDADPIIGGTVDGTGILTLQQVSNATTMGIAGGAGALNYSLADLAGMGSNWAAMRFGSTTATGTLTVGTNAWESPITYRAAAAGSIVVTGAQTAVVARDTTFTFSGPTTLGANVSTAAATGGTQDITFSDDVSLNANAQVLAGNGDLLFSGTVDGAFDLTLNAAGTITLSDDIGAGTPLDDLTITSDADPTIGGAMEGTGILMLQQASNATTMGIAGGAGALNYSLADLAGLGTSWTSVRLGSPTATGALTVGARAWDVPVDYRAAAAGSIVISGAQTAAAASDTIFTFSGPATINAALDLTNATGGTQAITFNDAAAVNADITSDGGDVAFNDTLSLGADILTGGGDITLADDVTLTGTSSIDTDTSDIAFAGTLDGTFDLTLTTTGDVDFSGDVGTGTALDDLTMTGATDVTFAGGLTAASFTLTGGTGLVLVTDTADLSGDINLTTTGAVTFGDAVTFGGDVAVNSGASDIMFNGTVDGVGDMELTTTNDILFADDVGGVTRLGDVLIDPRHFTAGAFNAASFTLTGGTGNVNFGGTGLNTTGNIAIDTNGNVTGMYAGANGLFDSGAGTITASVSFTGLDISGTAAALSGGYIGAPGPADQAMANLISIGGVSYPLLVPDNDYTFEGFIIGDSIPSGGGGGGTPPSVTPPVTDPGSNPSPQVPPIGPHPSPVISAPDISQDMLQNISRIHRSAQIMVTPAVERIPSAINTSYGRSFVHFSPDLLRQLDCDSTSQNISCDTLEDYYPGK